MIGPDLGASGATMNPSASIMLRMLHITRNQKMVIVVLGITFSIMVWGVCSKGWWMAEISVLFLGATLLVGLIAKMNEEAICHNSIEGAKDFLGVALIIAQRRVLR